MKRIKSTLFFHIFALEIERDKSMKDLFEGFVGIRLWDGQVLNDFLFTMILAVLILFAFVFRYNYRACLKMFSDVLYVKERQSLFDKGTVSDTPFRAFMLFQALLLCTLFCFSYFYSQGYLDFELTLNNILLCVGALFAIIFLFTLFKWMLYELTGMIFSDPNKFRIWRSSYVATMGTWGIFLYVPVVWSALWGMYPSASLGLFIVSYILCRFVIAYKALRIFYRKNTGILYINLYLCTQEILPLVFLYEGIVCLYNFIKMSTLWH